MSEADPAVVIFGPQKPDLSRESLNRLRIVLLSEPRLARLVAAIKELPSLWYGLLEHLPGLQNVPGPRVFEELRKWIDHGLLPQAQFAYLNTLLTPLTVIEHFAYYLYHVRIIEAQKAGSHAAILSNVRNNGVYGLCTGILPAFAIASSDDAMVVGAYGAVALRLAVCIGASVDLEGVCGSPPDEACCLVARHATLDQDSLEHVLGRFPDAYISVLADAKQATITISKATASLLKHELSDLGFAVKQISLEGRFHFSKNTIVLTKLLAFCSFRSEMHFPNHSSLVVPVHADTGDQAMTKQLPHEVALASILLEQSNWRVSLTRAISHLTKQDGLRILAIGGQSLLPRSLASMSGVSFDYVTSLESESSRASDVVQPLPFPNETRDSVTPSDRMASRTDIAIIGMSCRFAGADSVEELWEIISAGKSMHTEIPRARFSIQEHRRTMKGKGGYWANCLEDPDAFDHRFFGISSREAASMDPQQRIILEVGYEALLSSGYFDELAKSSSIGVYLGIGSVDYHDNLADHDPTAFSALGSLRAFISGRISHHFGWTGPSMTFDTACSSSAVAIHSACGAIRSGECSTALAGGVHIMTSPILHQNLSKAGFLSLTGASKAFDISADGYCRGEGAGVVILKDLSTATVDGDPILGVIAGSAVSQNYNTTPITVPDSLSQINLCRKVAASAKIDPFEISFVEAHGTGTPVGDPIESYSIRQVFGGQNRSDELYLGSIKSNIGHTEAASGVAGLIKAILMIQKSLLPMQANFTTLNPKIPPLETDRMAIPATTQSWNGSAICVSNYGAAGSNAAIIVRRHSLGISTRRDQSKMQLRYPIFISANSIQSLRMYCKVLNRFITDRTSISHGEISLADIAFNLAHRANHALPNVLSTSAGSIQELSQTLLRHHNTSEEVESSSGIAKRPVVLCFGSQSKDTIGLSEHLYKNAFIFRMHLDQCDALYRSFGESGFYPWVFRKTPIRDVVLQHCMLFAIQYSAAKSWIDCGLKPDILLGHSFGQLTALCVSASISLEDAMKLVRGRAALIRDLWGAEKGALLSVELDLEEINEVLSSGRDRNTKESVEIACYNNATNYVLAGSKSAISKVEEEITSRQKAITSKGAKRLQVEYGFHSYLVDPIMPGLVDLAESISFHKPKIPIETCTQHRSWSCMNPSLVAEHSRMPVYFADAVRRIDRGNGPCIWLDAGSTLSVAGMVRRVLGSSAPGAHVCQPVSLTAPNSLELLANTTVDLWKLGLNVQFFPFHRKQRSHYIHLNLPPYQFEKARHWLAIREASAVEPLSPQQNVTSKREILSLVSFMRPQNFKKSQAEFKINSEIEQFNSYVQGHVVLGSGLCPASVYIHLAGKALSAIIAGFYDASKCDGVISLADLEMFAPLMNEPNKMILLSMEAMDDTPFRWRFQFVSYPIANLQSQTMHASGSVYLQSAKDSKVKGDFQNLEQFVGSRRSRLFHWNEAETSIEGTFIYRAFSSVVEYANYYRGIRKIATKGSESVGSITVPAPSKELSPEAVWDPVIIDNFLQVAGLHINCLHNKGVGDIYICTKINSLHHSSDFDPQRRGPWEVFSSFEHISKRELINDISVYDPPRKRLVCAIIGAHFTRIQTDSLTKSLSQSISTGPRRECFVDHRQGVDGERSSANWASDIPRGSPKAVTGSRPVKQPVQDDDELFTTARQLLSRVTDVPVDVMQDDSRLEVIGVDSIMTTEVLNEIEKVFNVSIPMHDFQELVDLKSLCTYLRSRSLTNPDVSGLLKLERGAEESLTTDVPQSPSMNFHPLENRDVHIPTLCTVTEYTREALTRDLTNIAHSNLRDKCKGKESLTTENRQEIEVSNLSPSELQKPTSSPHSLDTNRKHRDLVRVYRLAKLQTAFTESHRSFDDFSAEAKLAGFTKEVYPRQLELVSTYVVDAFGQLAVSLSSIDEGEDLPLVPCIPKYQKLVLQLHRILQAAGLVLIQEDRIIRTGIAIPMVPASDIYEKLLIDFPWHFSEHKLLGSVGPYLADCVSGKTDPLPLILGGKANKDLLEDVYTSAPVFATGMKVLVDFISKVGAIKDGPEPLRVLEIGAGTGSTTKAVIQQLDRLGIPYTYTVTDISPSLVARANRKFGHRTSLNFAVLDCEESPPHNLVNSQDLVIATNAVHATKNLVQSLANIRRTLRDEGVLCLVELTRNLFWFDLVFGLLDGWWLFEDGRTHAIADESFWKGSLVEAGFDHIDWSVGDSEESNYIRLIVAVASRRIHETSSPQKKAHASIETMMETVMFEQVDKVPLYADIYYPAERVCANLRLPIALLVHGGGHVMLSRKDIRPGQTELLLAAGLLPVSVDHRLCPELSLVDGPMTDVCTALGWARNTLPHLTLARPDIHADGNRVVVVGWSTGGMLAMSLAWTSIPRGIAPPQAILAFYCPTDYASEWWTQPNFPWHTSRADANLPYDIWDAVRDSPLTGYNVVSARAPGGWMSTRDPRARIPLHMNWTAQTLPVLLGALTSERKAASQAAAAKLPLLSPLDGHSTLPMPSPAEIASFSPLSQAQMGNYRSPTFMVHGTVDEFIPAEHSRRMYDKLIARGVPAGLALVEGGGHLFEMLGGVPGKGSCWWQSVLDGYEFLYRHVGLRGEENMDAGVGEADSVGIR